MKKENSSPNSSKNSSSDSLNYMLRKDGLANGCTNSNGDYPMNQFSLTKKKSLKTTLYRIFTQRKKSNNSFNILKD
jgi:hypothetical protein